MRGDDNDGGDGIMLSRRDAIRGGAALGTLALASRIGAYAQVVEAQITEPRIQLGSDYAIHDNGGDLVINHDPNGDIIYYDATADQITTLKPLTSVTTEDTATKTIGSGNHHYAGDYDGADADARLDAAISAASNGDVIYLEVANYDASHSTGKQLLFVGTGAHSATGSKINGTWTLTVVGAGIHNIRLENCTINLDNDQQFVESFNGTSNSDIVVSDNRCRIVSGDLVSVTFESGTSDGIVDAVTVASVTDNGTNTVGTTT